MNVAVDKIMEARKYDGVASKLKADTAKKTAQKTAANGSDDALKTMFPFMADFAKERSTSYAQQQTPQQVDPAAAFLFARAKAPSEQFFPHLPPKRGSFGENCSKQSGAPTKLSRTPHFTDFWTIPTRRRRAGAPRA